MSSTKYLLDPPLSKYQKEAIKSIEKNKLLNSRSSSHHPRATGPNYLPAYKLVRLKYYRILPTLTTLLTINIVF